MTGYLRKYVVRRLNGPPPESRPPRSRLRGPSYGKAVDQALRLAWEAAKYPWSVRLKALMPLWLPWLKRRLLVSALEGIILFHASSASQTCPWRRGPVEEIEELSAESAAPRRPSRSGACVVEQLAKER